MLFDPAEATAIRLEPVQLEVVGECKFKAKPCKECGLARSNVIHGKGANKHKFRRQLGCANCGRNKGDRAHFGVPPSLNALASGMGSGNAMVYAGQKAEWQQILIELLDASGLPRGLSKVLADAELTFPVRARRDQGNFRVILEKALGDALQEGGWLENDDWEHYEFGALSQVVQPGVEATRIMIWPMMEEEA